MIKLREKFNYLGTFPCKFSQRGHHDSVSEVKINLAMFCRQFLQENQSQTVLLWLRQNVVFVSCGVEGTGPVAVQESGGVSVMQCLIGYRSPRARLTLLGSSTPPLESLGCCLVKVGCKLARPSHSHSHHQWENLHCLLNKDTPGWCKAGKFCGRK